MLTSRLKTRTACLYERRLAIERAAVRRLDAQPRLAQRAIALLDAWASAGDVDDSENALRSQWRAIIAARDWALALEDSERGDDLRRASPLGLAVLAHEERTRILACFSGSPAPAGVESPAR